jgi:bifunctional DNA-binding transcriptional regulator/antitoxin component of YhaV-PrlF toxin-antitoxin module
MMENLMRPAHAHVTIRRLGRHALRVVIPREIAERYQLNVGDHVVLKDEQDGVKLKFVRQTELEQLVESAASAA